MSRTDPERAPQAVAGPDPTGTGLIFFFGLLLKKGESWKPGGIHLTMDNLMPQLYKNRTSKRTQK